MTLQQSAEGGVFASVAEAMGKVDPSVIDIIRLLGDEAVSAYLVSWPPNTPPQPCQHDGMTEVAIILKGQLIDEDGTVHGPLDLWLRSPDQQHHPRSGPEGAQLILFRFS